MTLNQPQRVMRSWTDLPELATRCAPQPFFSNQPPGSDSRSIILKGQLGGTRNSLPKSVTRRCVWTYLPKSATREAPRISCQNWPWAALSDRDVQTGTMGRFQGDLPKFATKEPHIDNPKLAPRLKFMNSLLGALPDESTQTSL